MLFVASDKVDEPWEAISKAVVSGFLANFAKVSTSTWNATGTRPHLMCVYYPDQRDRTEVMRVRAPEGDGLRT